MIKLQSKGIFEPLASWMSYCIRDLVAFQKLCVLVDIN